ncbi:MAG: hypothetical protein PVG49_18030 [Desulfobacteraceae bacterium]|jgi:hypothetical protein
MKGWKTWAGGLLGAAAGIYLITRGELETGLGFLSASLTAIGIGHKIEKSGKN